MEIIDILGKLVLQGERYRLQQTLAVAGWDVDGGEQDFGCWCQHQGASAFRLLGCLLQGTTSRFTASGAPDRPGDPITGCIMALQNKLLGHQ